MEGKRLSMRRYNRTRHETYKNALYQFVAERYMRLAFITARQITTTSKSQQHAPFSSPGGKASPTLKGILANADEYCSRSPFQRAVHGRHSCSSTGGTVMYYCASMGGAVSVGLCIDTLGISTGAKITRCTPWTESGVNLPINPVRVCSLSECSGLLKYTSVQEGIRVPDWAKP